MFILNNIPNDLKYLIFTQIIVQPKLKYLPTNFLKLLYIKRNVNDQIVWFT